MATDFFLTASLHCEILYGATEKICILIAGGWLRCGRRLYRLFRLRCRCRFLNGLGCLRLHSELVARRRMRDDFVLDSALARQVRRPFLRDFRRGEGHQAGSFRSLRGLQAYMLLLQFWRDELGRHDGVATVRMRYDLKILAAGFVALGCCLRIGQRFYGNTMGPRGDVLVDSLAGLSTLALRDRLLALGHLDVGESTADALGGSGRDRAMRSKSL